MNSLILEFMQGVVSFGFNGLLPTMCLLFAVGIVGRILVVYTVKRNDWFVREFEKRVDQFIVVQDPSKKLSFFVIAKRLLEKTFYELFEVHARMKRARHDFVTPFSDRFFLIKEGTAWLVKDTLKAVKFIRDDGQREANLLLVSKSVFQKNPCFSKAFGIIPVGALNESLNILPGMFVVMGIFGTFLGIMSALPGLSGVDPSNIEATRDVVDKFLIKTSHAMTASALGIAFMIVMNFFNATFNPERIFVAAVDRFENALSHLWNRCDNNELPEHIPSFDEHKDPIEALAEQSVERELAKRDKSYRRKGNPNDDFSATGS